MLEPYNIIILLLNAFLVAGTAWVYSEPLTEPNEIFNPLYRFLDQRLPWYLFKPLIGCFKCVSGQWALWYYLFTYSHYNFFEHVFFIGSTILLALFINKIFKHGS